MIINATKRFRKFEGEPTYYKLEGKEVVKIDNPPDFMQLDKTTIKQDIFSRGYVTTVFVNFPLPENCKCGKPCLFETVVLVEEHILNFCEYCNYNEAIKGHNRAVELLIKEHP